MPHAHASPCAQRCNRRSHIVHVVRLFDLLHEAPLRRLLLRRRRALDDGLRLLRQLCSAGLHLREFGLLLGQRCIIVAQLDLDVAPLVHGHDFHLVLQLLDVLLQLLLVHLYRLVRRLLEAALGVEPRGGLLVEAVALHKRIRRSPQPDVSKPAKPPHQLRGRRLQQLDSQLGAVEARRQGALGQDHLVDLLQRGVRGALLRELALLLLDHGSGAGGWCRPGLHVQS
mmetsp:Transcript_174341/g.558888  ORF Transcript_174341/g.558888 Transcript_174341/m.558888 type:complete len:227 (-) Transcript_174341:76-756(-)